MSKKNKKLDLNDEGLFRRLVTAVFACYLVLLVWVVMFKCGMADGVKAFYVNFSSKFSLSYRFYRCIIPFAKIVVENGEISILPSIDINDMLNVFVFIPFGFFVSYIIGGNRKRTLIYTLGITTLLEAMQFLTLIGAFASKDIITNLIGAYLGTLLFGLYKKIAFSRVHNICAIIAFGFAVALSVVAVYTVVTNFGGYVFILLRKA